MRNIKDEHNLNQKKVLLRLDLNVPLNNGKITDTTRIDKILPTINFLLKNNAKVIILSHVGRPKGKVVNELSLKPICESLQNKLNQNIRLISKNIKEGILKKDLIGLIFNTIGVSDGISMGTQGMRYSLPSRDIIADSIETVVQAMAYDALITVVGCDKNMPGALMSMLRLNRPSILVYGGTIAPGCHNGKKLDVVSAFEAWGEKVSGKIDESEFSNIIKN